MCDMLGTPADQLAERRRWYVVMYVVMGMGQKLEMELSLCVILSTDRWFCCKFFVAVHHTLAIYHTVAVLF